MSGPQMGGGSLSGGTLARGPVGTPHAFDPPSGGGIPVPGQGKVQGNCVGVPMHIYSFPHAPNHHPGIYIVCN